MKENSIKNEQSFMEETIKTIEKMIKSYKEADKCGLSNNDFKNEIKALEHILQDYKRVLKENEILKEEKERAWEEWNNLEQGSYETEQKLKQQIKKLQKENEELKENNKYTIHLTDEQYNAVIEKAQNDIKQKWIQKVKDKIENLQNEKEEYYSQYKIDELNDKIQVLQELLEGRK